MTDDTYYEALGAAPDASRDELRSAYRDRIAELEAARDRKGVSEAQLRQNREETARVRAAWNVLSDPFQRKRYDEKLVTAETNGDGSTGDDVELVDDEPSDRPGAQLTGWRRLMMPPPKPAAKTGAGNGKQPPPRRPVREPTIPLPPGMRIAEPRSRGMALLFDFAVLLVIYWVTFLVVPGLVTSGYQTKVDNANRFTKMHDSQVDIDNAQKDITKANAALEKATTNSSKQSAQGDLKTAQDNLKSARKDFNDQAKDARKDGYQTPHDAKALQKQADKLSDDVRPATYAAYGTVVALGLLYLVPATAITGRTLGMRGRKIRVVRVDGSPVGWSGAFIRFALPLIVGIGLSPFLGPIALLLGLGIVLWGYRDANGQGFHDKLAHTLVVAESS